jgi:hypothetical protein
MQPQEAGQQLPPAFAASTGWQAMVVFGVVTVVLGLIISLHPSGSLNVVAVRIGRPSCLSRLPTGPGMAGALSAYLLTWLNLEL